ncbi:MAG TPA: hypothetical protein VLG28_00885 [Acidimicrobiia bacterium]|jgi:hypothetical protein|nr:hypothetical protein [Acidimicrobiia bacterium]
MGIFWGVVLVILGLIGWGGQLLSWLRPATAVRLGVMEAEEDVEPVFWVDIRAEAAWDSLVLWTLPVAGALLLLDEPAWAYFGLVGGGMYLYFAGRGIFARRTMQRRGMRIGDEQSVPMNVGFLALWGAVAAVTIVAALVALPVP